MSAPLPAGVEFTASNGLKVATDVRGAVSVQWGSPRAGGWTSHDPDETVALREFFAQSDAPPAPKLPWPWVTLAGILGGDNFTPWTRPASEQELERMGLDPASFAERPAVRGHWT